MTQFINCGAIDSRGDRVQTKKYLKRLVAASEEAETDYVLFDQTATPHSGRIPGNAVPADIQEGVTMVVVGPDPYQSRKWYAYVKRNKLTGRLVVT